ncbi:unnamed protein product [Amoebophrya sp. A25]|nr:unnamed protein product [Amoebophrya sp. A25]|eukprot:GSA25T00025951001.1
MYCPSSSSSNYQSFPKSDCCLVLPVKYLSNKLNR